eukprot:SAG11_NODE_621_length_8169_cov_2.866914_5_plen_96_part_00
MLVTSPDVERGGVGGRGGERGCERAPSGRDAVSSRCSSGGRGGTVVAPRAGRMEGGCASQQSFHQCATAPIWSVWACTVGPAPQSELAAVARSLR